jgi:hypothetical protein
VERVAAAPPVGAHAHDKAGARVGAGPVGRHDLLHQLAPAGPQVEPEDRNRALVASKHEGGLAVGAEATDGLVGLEAWNRPWLAAREVIVGTLGTLCGMEGDSRSVGLQRALRHDLTPGGAVALLVFFAFAMQCVSTVAVVRRETGGWRWPAIQFAWMTLLVYDGAFVANRVVTAFFA